MNDGVRATDHIHLRGGDRDSHRRAATNPLTMASDSQTWSNIDRTSSQQLTSWLIAIGEHVWKPLVYSSVYLALIAMAEVLIVRYLFSLPPTPAPIVVGLITFTIYANDRLTDLDTDAVSNPRRTAFVRRHRGMLYVLAALAYGLAVALSAFGGPIAFGLALLPGVAWVLYACEWRPATGMPFKRLKEILVVNSALVAVAWSATVVFLPIIFAEAPVTAAVEVVFLYFVLATFVNTEIANVRDMASDRRAGAATMPVVVGVPTTRRVLYGITLLTTGLLAYSALAGIMAVTAVGTLSIGLVCLLGVIRGIGRVENEQLLSVAAECTRLPVFALLAVPGLG